MLSEVRISRKFQPRLRVIRSIDKMHYITNVSSALKYEEVELIRSEDLSISLDTVKYLEDFARLNICSI